MIDSPGTNAPAEARASWRCSVARVELELRNSQAVPSRSARPIRWSVCLAVASSDGLIVKLYTTPHIVPATVAMTPHKSTAGHGTRRATDSRMMAKPRPPADPSVAHFSAPFNARRLRHGRTIEDSLSTSCLRFFISRPYRCQTCQTPWNEASGVATGMQPE